MTVSLGFGPSIDSSETVVSSPDTTTSDSASIVDLLALDVSALDQSGVRSAIAAVARWSGRLSSLESRLRDRQSEIAATHQPRPVPGQPDPAPSSGTGQLDGVLNISAAEGRRRDARSEVLRRIPSLRALLEDGRVSVEHLDHIANCARNVTFNLREPLWQCGEEIATLCTCSTPGQLRRRLDSIVTRLAVAAGVERDALRRSNTRLGHRLDPTTGMGRIWADLDPDLYERFASILERAVKGRTDSEAPNMDWLRAHVLVDLLTNGASGGSASLAPASPSVSVLIDHQTLIEGLHAASICEYADGLSLSVATARQLACNAEILPVVLSGDGVPLDVGRSRRLATAAQRSALAALHATCAIERCDVPFDRCEIHHVTPWEAGGRTDLSVLVPLCSHDHHEVHRRESSLTIDAERTLTVTEVDGTTTRHRPDRRSPRSSDDDDSAGER